MNHCLDDFVYIDESEFESVSTLGGKESVEIGNDSGGEIDEEAFYDYLINLDGSDRIETLEIIGNSQLKNLEIIKAFPSLRILTVWGNSIASYDGMEWFKNGEFLKIDSNKNRRRDIEKIALAPISRMYLDYVKSADFEAIGKCHNLQMLEIVKSPSPDFQEWRNVPLDYLKFIQGKFTELSDTGYIKTLRTLVVAGCRSFERFIGDNSSALLVDIISCKNFDISSINVLQRVKYVTVVDCAKEIALSDIPAHPSIRKLTFLSTKVSFDSFEFEKKMPNIEKIVIEKMTKEHEQLLRKANPNIYISKHL